MTNLLTLTLTLALGVATTGPAGGCAFDCEDDGRHALVLSVVDARTTAPIGAAEIRYTIGRFAHGLGRDDAWSGQIEQNAS